MCWKGRKLILFRGEFQKPQIINKYVNITIINSVLTNAQEVGKFERTNTKKSRLLKCTTLYDT